MSLRGRMLAYYLGTFLLVLASLQFISLYGIKWIGFAGELVWDSARPDGQPRRRVDASRAERELGWHATMDFEDGLRETVKWFIANRQEALLLPS